MARGNVETFKEKIRAYQTQLSALLSAPTTPEETLFEKLRIVPARIFREHKCESETIVHRIETECEAFEREHPEDREIVEKFRNQFPWRIENQLQQSIDKPVRAFIEKHGNAPTSLNDEAREQLRRLKGEMVFAVDMLSALNPECSLRINAHMQAALQQLPNGPLERFEDQIQQGLRELKARCSAMLEDANAGWPRIEMEVDEWKRWVEQQYAERPLAIPENQWDKSRTRTLQNVENFPSVKEERVRAAIAQVAQSRLLQDDISLRIGMSHLKELDRYDQAFTLQRFDAFAAEIAPAAEKYKTKFLAPYERALKLLPPSMHGRLSHLREMALTMANDWEAQAVKAAQEELALFKKEWEQKASTTMLELAEKKIQALYDKRYELETSEQRYDALHRESCVTRALRDASPEPEDENKEIAAVPEPEEEGEVADPVALGLQRTIEEELRRNRVEARIRAGEARIRAREEQIARENEQKNIFGTAYSYGIVFNGDALGAQIRTQILQIHAEACAMYPAEETRAPWDKWRKKWLQTLERYDGVPYDPTKPSAVADFLKDKMPDDVRQYIASYFSPKDTAALALVNQAMLRLVDDKTILKKIAHTSVERFWPIEGHDTFFIFSAEKRNAALRVLRRNYGTAIDKKSSKPEQLRQAVYLNMARHGKIIYIEDAETVRNLCALPQTIRHEITKIECLNYSLSREEYVSLVRAFPALTRLRLSFKADANLDEKSLSVLAHLPLRALILQSVGDREISALAACRTLERLDLWGTKVTDMGLRALSALPLKELGLSDRRTVGDDGMRALANCPLEKIVLSGTNVTIAGLRALENCPLQNLSVRGCPISFPDLMDWVITAPGWKKPEAKGMIEFDAPQPRTCTREELSTLAGQEALRAWPQELQQAQEARVAQREEAFATAALLLLEELEARDQEEERSWTDSVSESRSRSPSRGAE